MVVLILIIIGIALVLAFVIYWAVRETKKTNNNNPKKLLEYSDKVKNYHGKNQRREPYDSKYYDAYGKRKRTCDDSEEFFDGSTNCLLQSDRPFIEEFVRTVFSESFFDHSFIVEKINRVYDAKEKDNSVLIDLRYFLKNPNYIILPFHLTPDQRSNMILYYCQTRAIKCFKMTKTSYSSEDQNNYLAYFPLDCFDDMCFISYLMIKYPMTKGIEIFGFESHLTIGNEHATTHDKDFVFEYIYKMFSGNLIRFFPMLNAFLETDMRVLKAPGYPDASEWNSKQAEIKAEMQQKGLINSGLHNENERKLFFMVKELYPDAIYQYRDEWLGYLTLDIYIPSIKVAIEYQGSQHYKSVRFYGGKEALESIQKRDKTKEELCNYQGIKLIQWKYDVPITENNLQRTINDNIDDQKR